MAENVNVQERVERSTQGTPGFNSGKLVFDSTAIKPADYLRINLGFTPKYMKIINPDGDSAEWFDGMEPNTAFKTTAGGAVSLETEGFTVNGRDVHISQAASLGLVVADKTLFYIAHI